MKHLCLLIMTVLTMLGTALVVHAQDEETGAQDELLYYVNQKYGFRVEYPGQWTARKVDYPDPLPDASDFRAGKASISFSLNSKESANWNALFFLGGESISDVRIYAHRKEEEAFEDFMRNFRDLLPAMVGEKTEIITARSDATVGSYPAYEIVYTHDFGSRNTRTTLMVIYQNDIRYGLTFWAFENEYEKAQEQFARLLESFRILPDAAQK